MCYFKVLQSWCKNINDSFVQVNKLKLPMLQMNELKLMWTISNNDGSYRDSITNILFFFHFKIDTF